MTKIEKEGFERICRELKNINVKNLKNVVIDLFEKLEIANKILKEK